MTPGLIDRPVGPFCCLAVLIFLKNGLDWGEDAGEGCGAVVRCPSGRFLLFHGRDGLALGCFALRLRRWAQRTAKEQPVSRAYRRLAAG